MVNTYGLFEIVKTSLDKKRCRFFFLQPLLSSTGPWSSRAWWVPPDDGVAVSSIASILGGRLFLLQVKANQIYRQRLNYGIEIYAQFQG